VSAPVRAALALLLAATACGRSSGDRPLVHGEGVAIGEEDLKHAILATRRNLKAPEARALLDRMVDLELLAADAEASGYMRHPEVVRQARAAAVRLRWREAEDRIMEAVRGLDAQALQAEARRADLGRDGRAPSGEAATRQAIVKARLEEARRQRVAELRSSRGVHIDDARLERLLSNPQAVRVATPP